MKVNVQSILQGVLGEEHLDQPQCVDCHGGIPALIDAELDAEEMYRRFSSVKKHLASCATCREEYQELKMILKAARCGELVEPPFPPTFDFSYLEKQPPTPSTQQPDQATARLVRRIFSLFHLQACRLLALFLRRPISMTPTMLRRRASYTTAPGRTYRLSLPIQVRELQIGFVLGPPSPQNAPFGIQVHWAETGQPAERIQVDVCDVDKRVLASTLTSVEGRASFPRVSAGDYLLEVRHRDAVLQVPLALQLEAKTV